MSPTLSEIERLSEANDLLAKFSDLSTSNLHTNIVITGDATDGSPVFGMRSDLKTINIPAVIDDNADVHDISVRFIERDRGDCPFITKTVTSREVNMPRVQLSVVAEVIRAWEVYCVAVRAQVDELNPNMEDSEKIRKDTTKVLGNFDPPHDHELPRNHVRKHRRSLSFAVIKLDPDKPRKFKGKAKLTGIRSLAKNRTTRKDSLVDIDELNISDDSEWDDM